MEREQSKREVLMTCAGMAARSRERSPDDAGLQVRGWESYSNKCLVIVDQKPSLSGSGGG